MFPTALVTLDFEASIYSLPANHYQAQPKPFSSTIVLPEK
jgi:hypothetical protein